MSLKDKFKSNSEAVTNGVWFGKDDYPVNKDGTQPEFLIARMSANNPKYQKQLLDIIESVGDKKLTTEQDKAKSNELFADTVLLGWKHFQPEDDGVELEYSKKNVVAILDNSEWFDLVVDWRKKAANSAAFFAKKTDKTAKNL